MALHLRRRRRAGAPRPPVLRDVRQPRHLPPGLERGDQAQDAVGHGRRRPGRLRRRRLGAVRRQQGLDAGARPRRRRCRTSSHELQRQFLIEATRYNVLPLDDRRVERCHPGDRRSADAHPGQLAAPVRRDGPAVREQRRQHQEQVVRPSRPSVDVPDGGAEGTIIAQGGRFGGWSLYAIDGTAKFVYNVLGIHEFPIEATEPIPAGDHQVRMEFAYDGGGLAQGRTVTLYYDGKAVGRQGRLYATTPMMFSADETTDVGYESGTAVSSDYSAGDQPLQRHDRLGPDRSRRRRPRPPDRSRGATQDRDGPAVDGR